MPYLKLSEKEKTEQEQFGEVIDKNLDEHIKKKELSTLALFLGLGSDRSDDAIIKEAQTRSINEKVWENKANHYRIGFCAELSDKTLNLISESNFFKNPKKTFTQAKDGEVHFYITTDDETIIEPTYKQFLYRIFVDPYNGRPKKNNVSNKLDNATCVEKIDTMKGVFIGKKEDLIHKVGMVLRDELSVTDAVVDEATQFWKPI